jgi:drug/metabolite transporter (DMT)-like permease
LRAVTSWLFTVPALGLTAANVAGYTYLATIGGALAYLLWFRGIERLSPTTVSLLTLRSPLWRVTGVASFVVRYGFAAGALGVPAYLGLWPTVAMLCGFAGVYLVENVVLVPGMLRTAGGLGVRRDDGRSVGDGAERRAEA